MKRAILLAALCACGGSGMGPMVRNDIAAQMQSAQPALSACYAKALAAAPVQGMITVSFAAQPSTGQFGEVVIIQDQLRNPEVAACVVATISALKLAQPQDSRVAVSYPIHFAPNP